jgi:hypothetical protein
LADQQEKHSDSYQQYNQNTDDQRSYQMPTLDGLRSSAFLRCSDPQPEEKIAHLRLPSLSAASRKPFDFSWVSPSISCGLTCIQLPQDRPAETGAAASADAVPFRSHTWAGLPRGDIGISLGAHGAIFSSAPSLPPDVPRIPGRT